MNTADLIDQVVWLLERMSRGQILRVLSYANRLFCQEPQNGTLQRPSPGQTGAGRENPRPKNGQPGNG